MFEPSKVGSHITVKAVPPPVPGTPSENKNLLRIVQGELRRQPGGGDQRRLANRRCHMSAIVLVAARALRIIRAEPITKIANNLRRKRRRFALDESDYQPRLCACGSPYETQLRRSFQTALFFRLASSCNAFTMLGW